MLKTTSQTLKPGDPAPDFTLPTIDHKMVRLSDYRGNPLVIVFIRGTWCPNCTHQMTQFESAHDEFTKRKAGVVFIAAQKIEGLFKGKEHVQKRRYPFPVLFDETREVTKVYGVHHALGIDAYNLARRAIFVVGGEGRIYWIAVSPHQREAPAVEDVLSAIESCDKY